MTDQADIDKFDRSSWEERWAKVIGSGSHAIDQRPPNANFIREAESLAPGRALDAGAGHGAETLWLSTRGWEVTAVDFSQTALDYARSRSETLGDGVADRIEWVQADLSVWTPERDSYDLVACLYVHAGDSVPDLIRRLAAAVHAGGSLIMLGNRSLDQNPSNGQVQVKIADVQGTLDLDDWKIVVAEERARGKAEHGVDTIIHARRLR